MIPLRCMKFIEMPVALNDGGVALNRVHGGYFKGHRHLLKGDEITALQG